MRRRWPSSLRGHRSMPAPWSANRSAEGGGDAAVRFPDLLRQAVELGQVLLAVCDLLPPPADVDGEQPLEISGCDVAALEVELLDGGQDADWCPCPGSPASGSDRRAGRAGTS